MQILLVLQLLTLGFSSPQSLLDPPSSTTSLNVANNSSIDAPYPATVTNPADADFLIGGFYLRCTASLSERIPQANAESCIDKVKRAVDQKMDLPRPRIPNYDQIPRQNSWSFDGVRINITNFEKLGHRFSYKELLLLFGPDGLKRYMDQFHRHFKLGFIVLDINYAHKKYPIGRGTIENFQEIDVTSIS